MSMMVARTLVFVPEDMASFLVHAEIGEEVTLGKSDCLYHSHTDSRLYYWAESQEGAAWPSFKELCQVIFMYTHENISIHIARILCLSLFFDLCFGG